MKRSPIALIALIICVSLLSSCSFIVVNHPTESGTATQTNAPEQSETEAAENDPKKIIKDTHVRSGQYLATVEDADWNGGVVKIASAYPALSETEDQPRSLSSLIEERNEAVKEKLGVELVTETTDPASLFARLSVDVKSEMYYADLLMIPQNSAASLAASGLLFNLRSLPKFDLSAPYFNESSVEAGSAGYSSFFVAGELTCSLHTFHAMFFSRDAFAALGLDAPYSLVKSGGWTWDEYFALAAKSGELAPIATGAHGDEAADAAYVAMGGKFISAGVKKLPAIAVDFESLGAAVETIRRAFADPRALARERGGIGAFAGAMFMEDRLDAMRSLANSAVSWGVLPMPKASADEEGYITPASGDSIVVAVPAVLFSDELTSQVVRSLAAASAGRVPQAFITHAQNELLRDNDSALMLDAIVSDVRYDFAYTAGTMYPSAASASYYAIRNAVFDGEDAAAAIEYYRAICESELAAVFPME